MEKYTNSEVIMHNNEDVYGSVPAKEVQTKSRLEKPSLYPERFYVPEEKASFDVDFPEYDPPYFVAQVVIDNNIEVKDGGWADPEIFNPSTNELSSYEGTVNFSESGFPLNPYGRTGICGRGLLGKWGANFAADPIITRINSDTGKTEMIAIKRGDNGEWAIPGGMVEYGDSITKTLSKELEEEAGVKLNWDGAAEIYRGYVDDPRNTDNAWMETAVAHMHLDGDTADKLNMEAGDDATEAAWHEVDEEFLNSMYASHGKFVRIAITNNLNIS